MEEMSSTPRPLPRSDVCLVVAAWKPELKRLHTLLRCDRADFPIETHTVGVGLVEAAAGTARILAELRPARLVLIGTAGAFAGSLLTPPQVVCANRLILGVPEDPAVAEIPAPMPQQVLSSAAFGKAVARAARVDMAPAVCPLAITRCDKRAKALARASGASVENLEGFAVARAAALARVPLVVILGVANDVGPKGQLQWRTHGQAAAAAACDAFWAWRNVELDRAKRARRPGPLA